MEFGRARLFRKDISGIHRLQYKLLGVADPSHFLRGEYFKRYTDSLNPFLILDAGCGSGDYSFYMAERWPKAFIESIDLVEDSIHKNKLVQERWGLKNISFKTGDLKNIPNREQYDLIVCIDVLEHIVDQEMVLSNFFNALKKGGYLYIHIPLSRPRSEPFKRYLKHFHEWAEEEHVGDDRSREDILKMLEACKFRLSKNQYTFYYYFGEMACSLFSMFFKKSIFNRSIQLLLFPITRMLCYAELYKTSEEGFALAVLAQKK